MLYAKILVAYDGSKPADKALDTAVKLANMNQGCRLEVLYVYSFLQGLGDGILPVPSSELPRRKQHTEQLVRYAKQQAAHLEKARVVVLENGRPAQAILEYAEEERCDLIVIGRRGLGPLSELVLGSVSQAVLQQAKVPVLVVK